MIRRFDPKLLDPHGCAVAVGRRIPIDDRYFPLAMERVAHGIDLVRVLGHLGLHTDRARDQNHSSYYPWHEGMIWSLVLHAAGDPVAMLRRGRGTPRLIPLEPGIAIWLDITEVAHGIISMPAGHPEQHPEVVMVQVLGTPAFLFDGALQEAAAAIAHLVPVEPRSAEHDVAMAMTPQPSIVDVFPDGPDIAHHPELVELRRLSTDPETTQFLARGIAARAAKEALNRILERVTSGAISDEMLMSAPLEAVEVAVADLLETGLVEGLAEAVAGALGPDTACRVCGCTETDCSGCIARTGAACSWVENDLCSACVPDSASARSR
jgi:hypothetical protein